MKEKTTIQEKNIIKEKLEQVLKYIPAVTFICYVCGFIIYKTYLLQYGIIDTSIVNTRYFEAGILYLLLAPFVLATNLTTNRQKHILGLIFTALFAFVMYNAIFCGGNITTLWKGSLCVVGFNLYSYLAWNLHKAEVSKNLIDWTETPLRIGLMIIISLTIFSLYFKEIKPNFGGGKIYHKVLILKEKKDNLIKTDSLMHTDTLDIIYENNEFIYIKYLKSSKSIRKDLVEGEIYIKETPKEAK